MPEVVEGVPSSRVAQVRNFIAAREFSRAVNEINDLYRDIGSPVLDVLSRMLTILVTPTFTGDLASLGSVLGVCPPSSGKRLRSFLVDQRAQNCLTAVLRSLAKEVPSSVRVGFRSAGDFFMESEFYATYRADVVQYEPELRRLTDQRLARLLAPESDSLDWSLFDSRALEKKRDVLAAYEAESLRPIVAAFDETVAKVETFLATLSRHAGRFVAFFDGFRRSGFEISDDIISQWSLLGDEYFRIELSKSSLMLPISPKALYWGMHDDYPETLSHLRDLKALVTPDFTVSGPVKAEDGWNIDITCENQDSIRGGGFSIAPALHLDSGVIPATLPVGIRFSTMVPGRSYRMGISLPPELGSPLRLTLTIACEGRFHSRPCRTETSFDIEG